MPDSKQVFLAAVTITAICIILACVLSLLAPNPPTPAVMRLLDMLIYISIAGALTIFGLLRYRPTKEPPQ